MTIDFQRSSIFAGPLSVGPRVVIGRADAQIEIQNNGTGHTIFSAVLNQSPGNIINENAFIGSGYAATGPVVQMGAAYIRWMDTNVNSGYTTIGLHPNYFAAGVITSDVAFEVYGAHGIGMFLGAAAVPPTNRYLMIKRSSGNPSICGTTDLVLDANSGAGANNVFLNVYNSGDILIGLGGGKCIIGADPGGGDLFRVGGALTISDTKLITTKTAFINNAGAATGTLTNAPSAGNPTKWVTFNDAGVIRSFPTW